MVLKYFNKRNYTSIPEALSDIRKELMALWDREMPQTDEATGGGQVQQYMPQLYADTSNGGYRADYRLILEGNKVRVVDGATYNATTKTSDDMLVYVNGMAFYAAPFLSEPKDSDATFAIRFTSVFNHKGDKVRDDATVDIVDLSIEHDNTLPPNTLENIWWRVGRLHFNGQTPSVIQDHKSGTVNLTWIYKCTDFNKD